MFEEVTIGACRLIRGDCREVLPTLGRVDALVTDPPYGIALANHALRRSDKRRTHTYTIQGDEDASVGVAVLAWAEHQGLPTLTFAKPSHPWPGTWRNWLVWDKGGGVGGGGDPQRCWKQTWELIQIARNGPLAGARDNAVLRYGHGNERPRVHPAEKPVDLLAYLLTKLTPPGAIICDPCMGSGTTGVACVSLQRAFVGIEIEPRYFAIACERIAQASAQLDLLAPLLETRP